MKKELDDIIRNFDKAYYNEYDNPNHYETIRAEYLEYSLFFQKAFISENGYIVNTGNYQTVNRELIRLVRDKILKHPLLWKLFFMVA